MGELILCNQMLAASPYYIESAALNVYSIEELSYYMEHNLYLLETDFMNEELCVWIERELKLRETAQQLRDLCKRKGALPEFVSCILRQSGYCSPERIRQIASALTELSYKSDYECGKLRADRLIQNKRYLSGIHEYRRLLAEKEEKNEVLVGNVWHNLGRAYACLFLFREAADCFKQAYERNQNPESLRECLYACRCMQDEKSFRETAEEYGLSEEQIMDLSREFTELSRMEEIRQFEAQIEELFAEGREQDICRLVEEWKDTYRKNCRI